MVTRLFAKTFVREFQKFKNEYQKRFIFQPHGSDKISPFPIDAALLLLGAAAGQAATIPLSSQPSFKMWKTQLNQAIREVRFVLKQAPAHHGLWYVMILFCETYFYPPDCILMTI